MGINQKLWFTMVAFMLVCHILLKERVPSQIGVYTDSRGTSMHEDLLPPRKTLNCQNGPFCQGTANLSLGGGCLLGFPRPFLPCGSQRISQSSDVRDAISRTGARFLRIVQSRCCLVLTCRSFLGFLVFRSYLSIWYYATKLGCPKMLVFVLVSL